MTFKLERVETSDLMVEGRPAKVSIRIWEPRQAIGSVLCVHHFAGTNHDFAPLANALAKRGVSLVAPDMFGRESTFFNDPSRYTLRNQLLAVSATERYQQPRNCILGSSWGGLIALAQVSIVRWRVNGLVLNDCPIHSNASDRIYHSFLSQEALKSFETRREAVEHLIESRALHFLEGELRNRILKSQIVKTAGKWRLSYDPALCGNSYNEIKFSAQDLLKKAPKPVLMNFGSQSPYAADPANAEIAHENPFVKLLTTMSASHPPSLMREDEVAVITNFIMNCFEQP